MKKLTTIANKSWTFPTVGPISDVPDNFYILGNLSKGLAMQSSKIADRVRERLDKLGINPAEAARKLGKERAFLHDLLSGRKKTVTGEALVALAQALECSPEFLVGASDKIKVNQMDVLPLVGIIEPSVWRAPNARSVSGAIPLSNLDRFGGDEVGYMMRGNGASQLEISDGSVVVVETLQHPNLIPGAAYVVVRSRGDLTETSLREVIVHGGQLALVLPTTEIADEPILWPVDERNADKISVVGRVKRSVKFFNGDSFKPL